MDLKSPISSLFLTLVFVGITFAASATIIQTAIASADSFDIAATTESWDKLLKKHLKEEGAVDYQGFKKDHKDLESFIGSYKKLGENALTTDSQKTAAYINLYNAAMIYNLLKYANSKKMALTDPKFLAIKINDIEVPGGNIWNGDYKVNVGKHSVNLDGIEHGLIRRKAGDDMDKYKVSKIDPRIHSAVNCAALSCPPIRSDAYTADNLDTLLNENMKAWLSSNEQFSKTGDSLRANSIVHWYYSDFDDYAQKTLKTGGAGDYLSQFISSDAVDAKWKVKHLKDNFNDRSFLSLKLSNDFSFYYDWHINDVRNFKVANK